ncbi:hypothetical protein Bbelb_159880 [Branchiostoma belcheri]|nr:hypothetical protein Bbelb_159880 [Branchiostoma belcheri]
MMEMRVPNAQNEDHQYASNIPGDQHPNSLQHPNPMYPQNTLDTIPMYSLHTQDDTDFMYPQNTQNPNLMYISHTQDDTDPINQQNTQDPNPMYTSHTQDDRDPMYPQNTQDPNLMYISHTQDDTDPTNQQNTQDPNPMYTLHTQDDTDHIYQQNTQDPNPMYAPSDLNADLDYPENAADLIQPYRPEPASLPASSEDNVFNRPSAGRSMTNNETSVKTAYSDDDPYIQPYATYRGEEGDRDDSETNPTRQTEAHTPASVSEDSNIQGTHNPPGTGRPQTMHVQNPTYLGNVPQQPPSVWTCRKVAIIAVIAALLVASTIGGIIAAFISTAASSSIFKMAACDSYGVSSCKPIPTATFTSGRPAVNTTYTTGYPAVDTTNTTSQPAVDTTNTTGYPAVDTTNTTSQPAVDTAYTTGHPAVDSTYTTGYPAVVTTYTTAYPAVDTTYTTGHPAVVTTYTTGHPAVDTTYTMSCPNSYIKWRETCYKAFNKQKAFSEAAETCREDGGTLAMPRDDGANAFLFSILHFSPRWIGLHDTRGEGEFEWVDGSALGHYSLWFPGRPVLNSEQNCVVFVYLGKGKWWDVSCGAKRAFFCQITPGAEVE